MLLQILLYIIPHTFFARAKYTLQYYFRSYFEVYLSVVFRYIESLNFFNVKLKRNFKNAKVMATALKHENRSGNSSEAFIGN